LAAFLDLVRQAIETDAGAGPPAVAASLQAQAEDEQSNAADGVNLLTLHRAKGLEWDAVFLPGLEEGSLPVRQADTPEAIAEERRLLYVGLTRARRHLLVSWAESRVGPNDRESHRRPSRFLRDLQPAARDPGGTSGVATGPASARGRPRVITDLGGPALSASNPRGARDQRLLDALRAWRTGHAREGKVPAYVIAPDSLLEALVDRRPDSIAALRRVPGMGPMRIERYGADLLAIIGRA
jgi:DNA helicase-2/ATP-dependent DNA helicase PcrA